LLAPLYEVIAKFKQLTQEKINAITEELKSNHENKNRFHQKAINAMRAEYDAIETKISNLLDLRIDAAGVLLKRCLTRSSSH